MKILPRLLYSFQTLPIMINQNQFNEWDKMLSRYIWQGKKPRVRFKTLQLAKEKGGGGGLPSLRDYYFAAQMGVIICWCNPSYEAQWKNMEQKISLIPIQATLADNNIQEYIKTIDNPWVNCTLTVWKSIITEYKLTEEIVPLKWCAYDSEFTPNRLDTRFKDWIDKGITVLCNLIEDNILASFEVLKEKHSLDTQDFYRYLQMRHFVNIKMKNMAETRTGFIELFRKAYKSDLHSRIVSCIYKCLLNLKTHSTYYIKTKWEKEGGIIITEEEWITMWRYQWKCSKSQKWREFGWKSLIRYFITPAQKSHHGN